MAATPNSRPSIFVSHTWDDNDLRATRRVVEALEKAGYVVWWDQRSLHGGDVLWTTIATHIRRCTVFVVLLSPTALKSRGVATEIDWAVHAEIHPASDGATLQKIVPVVVEPCDLSDLLHLSSRKYITVHDRWDAGWAEILAALPPTPSPTTAGTPPTVAAAAAVAAVGGSGVMGEPAPLNAEDAQMAENRRLWAEGRFAMRFGETKTALDLFRQTLPPVPPTIPGYELLGQLGEGGQARVFLARPTAPGAAEYCAIKVGPLAQPERFEIEVRLMQELRHPNLIDYRDSGTLTDNLGRQLFWIAMPAMHERTLAHHISSGLEIDDAVRIIENILAGLSALHDHNIIHRDLTPYNVLFDGNGRAKIIDFGLAKIIGDSAIASELHRSLTLTGSLVGTAPYMAPEQLEGKPLSLATDIWAVGVVAVEMLTGRRLWSGKTAALVHVAILTRDPDLGDSRIPPELLPFLRRCLHRDSADRFSDAKAAAAEFATIAGPLVQRIVAERLRSRWQRVRDGRWLESFAAQHRGQLPPNAAAAFVQYAADHGIPNLPAKPLADMLRDVFAAETRAAQANLRIQQSRSVLHTDWEKITVSDLRNLATEIESRETELRERRAEITRTAERVLAPFVEPLNAGQTAPAATTKPGGTGTRPSVPGYTFLGEQEFSCPNDVEGEKRFVLPVYRCDAFVQALLKAGKLTQEPTEIFVPGQRRNAAVDCEFVLLPPPGHDGRFVMGDDGDVEIRFRHRFLIARTAVTQRVYLAIGGEHDEFDWPGDMQPANEVSWNDITGAKGFNARAGLTGLRLPSEAEWEFACRAGTQTPFCFGSGKTVTSKIVNFDGNYPYGGGPKSEYRQRTVEVGTLPMNGFGLFEVHGNVWEWCADAWVDSLTGIPADGTARETTGASFRVYRGGGWGNHAVYCRSADRSRVSPGWRGSDLGFRPLQALSN